MKTKEGDYIEIDYVAKLADSGKIFDITDEKAAKFHNIYDPKLKYQPCILCIGKRDVILGLDEFLKDKELNKEYEVEIEAEKAFGKRDAKLIKLVPTSTFTKQQIQPFPGLQVNINDMMGTIKTVTGGRTLVDFNHPLSGHRVTYKIKINRIITDSKEKIQGFIRNTLNIDAEIDVKEGIADIKTNLPKALHQPIIDELKKRIPELKDIKITVKS